MHAHAQQRRSRPRGEPPDERVSSIWLLFPGIGKRTWLLAFIHCALHEINTAVSTLRPHAPDDGHACHTLGCPTHRCLPKPALLTDFWNREGPLLYSGLKISRSSISRNTPWEVTFLFSLFQHAERSPNFLKREIITFRLEPAWNVLPSPTCVSTEKDRFNDSMCDSIIMRVTATNLATMSKRWSHGMIFFVRYAISMASRRLNYSIYTPVQRSEH